MVKIIEQFEMEKALSLCEPWERESVINAAGGFGIGVIDEKQGFRAVLFADEQENEAVITALRFDRKRRPKDAMVLLCALRGYMDMRGIETARYSYLVDDEQPDMMGEMLTHCGWQQPTDEAIVYRLNLRGLDLGEEKGETKEIVPFFSVYIEERAKFSRRFGQDIPQYLNYNTVEDADHDLSLGCVINGKLVGYIICVSYPEAVELRLAFVDERYKAMMGRMLQRLNRLIREKRPNVNMLYVCAAEPSAEKLVQRLFRGRILKRRISKKSVFKLKGGREA